MRDRARQTLWFEGLGLLLIAPAYAWVTGASHGDSLGLLAIVSITVMAWTALYNTAFDYVEHCRCARVASDRPRRLRVMHAIGLELGAATFSLPLIWTLTDLGWRGALAVNLGLTVTYVVYGYVFHLAFDRLYPLRYAATPAPTFTPPQ